MRFKTTGPPNWCQDRFGAHEIEVAGMSGRMVASRMFKHRHSHLFPGVPLALASAALFGATPPLSKLLLDEVNPFMLAGLLYLGAGIGLAIYRLLRGGAADDDEARTRQQRPTLARTRHRHGRRAGAGPSNGRAHSQYCLKQRPASDLEGLATMAIAWLVYRENVDRRLLLGALAILTGAVLLSWQGQGLSVNLGALAIAGACVAWGLDNNFTRNISAADPVTIAILKGLVAGSVNVAIAFAGGASVPPIAVIVSAATVGLFGIGVSLVMFIFALRHLGTARTGAYYSLAPFIGALLAIVVLGEPVTVTLGLAGLLMGLGLWLHLSERHSHEHLHDALDHEHSHVHDDHHQHVHDGPVTEPHSHWHSHRPMQHAHVHYPDLHHQHRH